MHLLCRNPSKSHSNCICHQVNSDDTGLFIKTWQESVLCFCFFAAWVFFSVGKYKTLHRGREEGGYKVELVSFEMKSQELCPLTMDCFDVCVFICCETRSPVHSIHLLTACVSFADATYKSAWLRPKIPLCTFCLAVSLCGSCHSAAFFPAAVSKMWSWTLWAPLNFLLGHYKLLIHIH